MANEEHLKLLKQGVPAWNVWRANTNVDDPDLTEAELDGLDLSGVDLSHADLSKASLHQATLSHATFHRAKLREANLSRASLVGADLREADLVNSSLYSADLRGVNVDSLTMFQTGGAWSVNVGACKIDRYAIEHSKEPYGLTPQKYSIMNISDDLADLRASYSGLRLWVHLIALCLFLFPYMWFLGFHYSSARFFSDQTSLTIPLWKALARYIWNGGQNWEIGWYFNWSFVAFIFLVIYNGIRGLLLWKTNGLEHREQITGIRERFSLTIEPFWRRLIRITSILFWASLVVLALNTYHFLSQEIPLGAPL